MRKLFQRKNISWYDLQAQRYSQVTSDPPIHVGSIVRVKIAWWWYPGIVVAENIWEPGGGYRVFVPGEIGNTGKIGKMVETSLELCYNATEAERKIYFKNVLKYGQ